jgi:hypothetical protein
MFGLGEVDQKPYNSSIKSMKTIQWDEMRFLSSGSALEIEKRTWKMNLVAAGLTQRLFQQVFEKWVERCKKCIAC